MVPKHSRACGRRWLDFLTAVLSNLSQSGTCSQLLFNSDCWKRLKPFGFSSALSVKNNDIAICYWLCICRSAKCSESRPCHQTQTEKIQQGNPFYFSLFNVQGFSCKLWKWCKNNVHQQKSSTLIYRAYYFFSQHNKAVITCCHFCALFNVSASVKIDVFTCSQIQLQGFSCGCVGAPPFFRWQINQHEEPRSLFTSVNFARYLHAEWETSICW